MSHIHGSVDKQVDLAVLTASIGFGSAYLQRFAPHSSKFFLAYEFIRPECCRSILGMFGLSRAHPTGMAHDKSQTRAQDAVRVNVHEGYEVGYWCGRFGCTSDELKAAVRKVGVMAKDVEAELKTR